MWWRFICNSAYAINKNAHQMPTRRHFLETGPDPIAMVIRVELFSLKPSEIIQICTAGLLPHDYVIGGVCLAGIVNE